MDNMDFYLQRLSTFSLSKVITVDLSLTLCCLKLVFCYQI